MYNCNKCDKSDTGQVGMRCDLRITLPWQPFITWLNLLRDGQDEVELGWTASRASTVGPSRLNFNSKITTRLRSHSSSNIVYPLRSVRRHSSIASDSTGRLSCRRLRLRSFGVPTLESMSRSSAIQYAHSQRLLRKITHRSSRSHLQHVWQRISRRWWQKLD
jgi:hypothetical protein